MRARLAFNASALLYPLTGVGYYARNLMSAIGQNSDLLVKYFYNGFWSDRILHNAPAGASRVREIVKRIVPRPYQVSRYVNQFFFSRGVKAFSADLYHEPNFLPFRFEGPTVITVHDLSYLRYPDTHPRLRVEIMESLLPRAIERANLVLVDSEFVRGEILSEFGTPPAKVVTTLLGVSSAYRPMGGEEIDATLRGFGLQYRKYLLAVGTLEPRKNLVQALRAYRRLAERSGVAYPLAIVGMKGWLVKDIEREMEPLIRNGQVRLLGYVSGEALPQVYAGSRMLIYPSLYEGFGLPPLEAMASGVPVITSNQASLPEVVGDAGVQVHPHDLDGLVEAMSVLIEDDAEWQRRSALGLERSRMFSWARCAAATVAAYRRVLGVTGTTTAPPIRR
jgi:alpha-1,3-rhamnosyl/mannosyltransferase